MRLLCSTICLLLLLAFSPALAEREPDEPITQPQGWSFPTIGAGNGDWALSTGVFLWTDTAEARNLQLRADVDLGPGLRYHMVGRSNRELDTLDGFDPHFDEHYLEAYGFHRTDDGAFSGSLRVGTVRYLRFPYPDAIAVFDQVPGVGDLFGGKQTGYSGEMLTLDYAHRTGLGAHVVGLHPDFGRDGDSEIVESYVFLRRDVGPLQAEARAGRLAVRPEPLGRSEPGYSLFLGVPVKNYTVGVLYENLENQPAYTGLMVGFSPNRVTRAIGKVALDYDRTPRGIALQAPLASGHIGRFAAEAPKGATLVGEVKAERLRTYWQNGQVRNYYEHRLSSWGETGRRDAVVVAEEGPWYLQSEALVSPHTDVWSWEALKEWEDDRQGPAQLSQQVIYRFYVQE